MQSKSIRLLQLGMAFSATLAVALVGVSFRGETEAPKTAMVCKQAEWPIKSVACLDAAISRKVRLADDFNGAEILNVGAKADSSLARVSEETAAKGDRLPILNDPEVYFKTVEIRGEGSSELARISVQHIN